MSASFYGTLAAADAYFADRANAGWAAASDGDRLAALVRGSQAVDSLYEPRFTGRRTEGYDQVLSWPRSEATTVNGEPITENTLPLAVTYAAYEAAALELSEPGSLTPVIVAARTVKREKVGPLETEYAVADTSDEMIASARPMLTMLDGLLYPLLRPVLPGILVV
ncbi:MULTISPECIES: DnaT-like ssDNA-binding protein [unclassified Rhizobium]|jgi:hypothetical protein|uniref:DnaT-like ssDNA-binding protein n=1 Tax=unclassified Rhizobium TaxID=2613769 RepID=UPI000648FAB3|nr:MULTISPECIES: DnaT-like ssDNA-binding protein [unclassified Rhizobium]MBN8951443.1 hypothetical protein [Rhizobium tropici]OJY74745.1 MAG: hypothetical protein BGP09_33465 [Rhizobium sp. 60-20]RKD66747.1 hypothetical protein BJ928_106275 [Rhizobium sp. WW_1]